MQDKKQYEGKGNADGIRIQCRIVDEFFDAVFGSGTADMLFHGKSNLREHLEAFGAVSDAARESNDDLFALADRYAPNRAARRQMQKQQEKKMGPGFVSASGYSILNEDPGPVGNKGPSGLPGIPSIMAETEAGQDSQKDIMERITRILPVLESFAQAQSAVYIPSEGKENG